MYRLDREEFVQSRYVGLWSALGFQAGFINAFGFLACGRYVSHVTGFGTQVGVSLASQNWLFALELMGFPLSFIAGAFVNGIFTSARIERKQKPRFERVMLAVPILLGALMVTGLRGDLGPFGEDLLGPRDFFLLYSLSFLCGLQNGCFAVLTKGQIRTTHLTGISTDIGTDLARLFRGDLNPVERSLTRRTNFSRGATFVCFGLGSVVSVLMAQQFQFLALAVPLATSAAIFVAVNLVGKALDRRFASELSPEGERVLPWVSQARR